MKTARWLIGGFLLFGIGAAMMQTCLDHRRRRATNHGTTGTFPDPMAPAPEPAAPDAPEK